jgi:MioC protein
MVDSSSTESVLSDPLLILVGTMTGTAEMVADEMSEALRELGLENVVKPMDGILADVFVPGRPYLIVSSTYGQGDVPDNALSLYNDLCERKPDLTGIRYGVFSLGDRTYAETFNRGGKRFDEILSQCGAARIGEVFTHDASAGTVPEEEGVKWVKDWAKQLEEVTARAA